MSKTQYQIEPYIYHGLLGRKLYAPSRIKTGKKFLLVYGHHISIERLLPMVGFLSNYGSVYLMDNPGFGNMEPSYKLGQKASLDFYDGHLKQIFDKELPGEGPLIVVGISFGFQIVTHFLQSYPDYQQRISEVISFVGFTKHSEMQLPKSVNWLFKYVLAGGGQTRLGAWLARYIFFQPLLLVPLHMAVSLFSKKLKGKPLKTRLQFAREQAWLWKYNDPRTHAYTGWQFLTRTDLTATKVDLRCHHVYVEHDQYVDNRQVISNLNLIYSAVKPHPFDIPTHSPIDLDDEYKIAELVPEALRSILKS